MPRHLKGQNFGIFCPDHCSFFMLFFSCFYYYYYYYYYYYFPFHLLLYLRWNSFCKKKISADGLYNYIFGSISQSACFSDIILVIFLRETSVVVTNCWLCYQRLPNMIFNVFVFSVLCLILPACIWFQTSLSLDRLAVTSIAVYQNWWRNKMLMVLYGTWL